MNMFRSMTATKRKPSTGLKPEPRWRELKALREPNGNDKLTRAVSTCKKDGIGNRLRSRWNFHRFLRTWVGTGIDTFCGEASEVGGRGQKKTAGYAAVPSAARRGGAALDFSLPLSTSTCSRRQNQSSLPSTRCKAKVESARWTPQRCQKSKQKQRGFCIARH